MIEKKQADQIAQVLEEFKSALLKRNVFKLKELSNAVMDPAARHQEIGSLTIATLIYTLGKFIELGDFKKIRNWDVLIKKFNSTLDLAISALRKNKDKAYRAHIQKARSLLTSQAISLKPYIQDVLKKASIHKGSQLYRQGLSLEQTAHLLGISQWELADYIGQGVHEVKQHHTIDIKKRAKMALEFFGASK